MLRKVVFKSRSAFCMRRLARYSMGDWLVSLPKSRRSREGESLTLLASVSTEIAPASDSCIKQIVSVTRGSITAGRSAGLM